MKVILKVPGYTDTTFDSYEDLNFIWEILANYKDCSLEVIYEDTNNMEPIKETVDNKKDNKAVFSYEVPKQVTFTKRFQDRVKEEIEDVLNSVYSYGFEIEDIKFKDDENMIMSITIKALNSDSMNAIDYLDENIGFIIKDLIDYYMKG